MEENQETIMSADAPKGKIKKTTGIVYIMLICIFTLAIIGDMIIFAVVPSNEGFGGNIGGGRGDMLDTSDTAMMNPNGGGMGTDFDGEMPDTDFGGGEVPDGAGGDMSMPDGEAPGGNGGERLDTDFSGEAPDGAGGDMSVPEGDAPDGDGGERLDTDFANGDMGGRENMDTDFEEMRGNMGGGQGGMGDSNSVLSTIRRYWLPILIVCAVGDAVCVILYIFARRRAHKKLAEQYSQPSAAEPTEAEQPESTEE